MTPIIVSFSVDWVHGWQRAGVNHRTRDHFTQARTATDEQEIALRYGQACKERYGMLVSAPEHVPVTLKVDAYMRKPKKYPKYLPKWLRPRIPFTVKPDADNIAKLMDGLNGIAWADDAQVTNLIVRKRDREGNHDRTVFTVLWLQEFE